MNHGLSPETVAAITEVFARFPAVEKAVLYGSRAKGNYRKGSDIDLTLFGEKLTREQVSQIWWALDDLPLPYKIDLSVFHELMHPELIEHIRRVGKIFYELQPQKNAENAKP